MSYYSDSRKAKFELDKRLTTAIRLKKSIKISDILISLGKEFEVSESMLLKKIEQYVDAGYFEKKDGEVLVPQ